VSGPGLWLANVQANQLVRSTCCLRRRLSGLQDDEHADVKKDLKIAKKQIVAANMDLTDAGQKKFWPIYDQ